MPPKAALPIVCWPGFYDVLQGARPDLVLSGVNRGNNAAENVLYSGTVGGAMEAALQGLPAIALSQFMGPETEELASPFDAAIGHGEAVVRALLDKAPWDQDDYRLFYNVNFPPIGRDAVKGIKVVRQGYRKDTFFRRGTANVALWAAVFVDKGRPTTHAHGTRHRCGGQSGRLHFCHAHARGPDRRRRAGRCAKGTGMSDATDPTPDAQEARMRFIYTLRSRGVTDMRVLQAMEKIDRSAFLTGLFRERAYEDTPLPIACGQTISQPSVVALMTEALDVGPRDKVLEVGTGSGYQAAILSQLARRVYTVERHRALAKQAQGVFDALGLVNITAIVGDGSHGLPDQAPFDRIIVTAAAEDPPGPLLAQLKIGGIMVVPVGQSDTVQNLIRVHRQETGFEYEELRAVRFVPLVEGLG